MFRSSTLAFALLLLLAPACADEIDPDDTGAEAPQPEPGVDVAELQAIVDAYVRSLVDRDVNALAEIVSTEVLARGVDRGIELEEFLEKQRRSMLRTFGLTDGEKVSFDIAEVSPTGEETIRVSLSFRGEPLKKDLYFVREGDQLKLNIARPGFSRSQRGRSNYQIHNVNGGGDAVTMMCDPNNLTVAGGETHSVSCTDHCGWWSGTYFQRQGFERLRYCDWNSWGDDVIINFFYADGWDCNDYC